MADGIARLRRGPRTCFFADADFVGTSRPTMVSGTPDTKTDARGFGDPRRNEFGEGGVICCRR